MLAFLLRRTALGALVVAATALLAFGAIRRAAAGAVRAARLHRPQGGPDHLPARDGGALDRHGAAAGGRRAPAYLPVASFISVSVPMIVTNMVLTEIVFNVAPRPVPDCESLVQCHDPKARTA